MDEAQEILLSSLESSGVALPPGVSSARGLSPDALLSISAQCLRLIDPSSPPLPASLPASAADRFKACTDVAAAVRSLGYRGQLTFRQLLYPSDDDSYKLLRFLVEVLSESSEGSKNAGKKLIGDKGGGGQAPDQSNDSVYTEQFRSKQECHSCGKEGSQHPHESEMDGRDPTFEKDMLSQRSDEYSVKLVEKLDSLHRQVSEMKSIDEDQQSQERLLMEDVHAKASEVQDLEYVFAILKVLSEMAFYDCRRTELYIEELNKRVEARRCNLLELESQWNTCIIYGRNTFKNSVDLA
uniref:Coiled-coil domain-containing protein 22 n=1 Tax=Anthurium amnicola TaxID=1678845 RepID=A0A1D1Z6I0_9ARAE